MPIIMCEETSYAWMEKFGLRNVGVQDRSLKLCPGAEPDDWVWDFLTHYVGQSQLTSKNLCWKSKQALVTVI